jgi:hypothetical protein
MGREEAPEGARAAARGAAAVMQPLFARLRTAAAAATAP